MTFQAYARARRLSSALSDLRRGGSIDAAAFSNGFESHSGFRSAFARTFGGPPGRRRDARCVSVAMIQSPLGPLVAGAGPAGVGLLEFADRRALETQISTLSRRLGLPLVPGESPHLEALRRELAEYFEGRRARFDVPLDLAGTPFQREVWAALLRIPFGETRSYAAVAREIGRPAATRAVGRANGQNRVAIVVPCHRVVNEGGGLGGYGGGLRRKERLLWLEREAASRGQETRGEESPSPSRWTNDDSAFRWRGAVSRERSGSGSDAASPGQPSASPHTGSTSGGRENAARASS